MHCDQLPHLRFRRPQLRGICTAILCTLLLGSFHPQAARADEKPKSFKGNKPETVKPATDGTISLPASACAVYGKTLEYMPEDRALGYWNSPNDHAVWTMELPEAGEYEVWFEWSCAKESAGNTFHLIAGKAELKGKIPSTKTWQNHQKAKFGQIELPAGKTTLDLRVVPPIRVALADIREIKLVPVTPQPEANDQSSSLTPVGVAKVDITPDYPIHLTGYGNRQTESEGVEQKIWARALAIGEGADAAVLVTVDNLGVPGYLTDDVANRLQRQAQLRPEQFAICSSHTHTGPFLRDVAPTLIGRPIPDEHQKKINRYTRELAARIESVALAALADRKPARLSWNQGSVGFAKNRRLVVGGKEQGMGVAASGPVDHSLPMLLITEPDGAPRVIFVTYACHCTTLEGSFNKIAGDWLGYAVEAIERDHPKVTALCAIGCGADANPQPRGSLDFAKQHGEAMAREVNRLLTEKAKPLHGPVAGKISRLVLPFDTLPTVEQWRAKQEQGGALGYYAQVNLEKLSRGESLPTTLPYRIQTWTLGAELAFVFLAGEVVVDYATYLRQRFDPERLWIIAYANDDPCYIPSKRILSEGGYEADSSMIYYNRPSRLAPATEDIILDTVVGMLPTTFHRP